MVNCSANIWTRWKNKFSLSEKENFCRTNTKLMCEFIQRKKAIAVASDDEITHLTRRVVELVHLVPVNCFRKECFFRGWQLFLREINVKHVHQKLWLKVVNIADINDQIQIRAQRGRRSQIVRLDADLWGAKNQNQQWKTNKKFSATKPINYWIPKKFVLTSYDFWTSLSSGSFNVMSPVLLSIWNVFQWPAKSCFRRKWTSPFGPMSASFASICIIEVPTVVFCRDMLSINNFSLAINFRSLKSAGGIDFAIADNLPRVRESSYYAGDLWKLADCHCSRSHRCLKLPLRCSTELLSLGPPVSMNDCRTCLLTNLRTLFALSNGPFVPTQISLKMPKTYYKVIQIFRLN